MSIELYGAQRRISCGYHVPGNVKPQYFTFWPGRTNRIPSELVEKLREMKGSKRDDGEEISPFDEYLDSGMLWKMTATEANRILDAGGRPMPHKEGAGENTNAPEMKDLGLTTKEQAVVNSIPTPTTHTIETQGKAAPPPAPVIA